MNADKYNSIGLQCLGLCEKVSLNYVIHKENAVLCPLALKLFNTVQGILIVFIVLGNM